MLNIIIHRSAFPQAIPTKETWDFALPRGYIYILPAGNPSESTETTEEDLVSVFEGPHSEHTLHAPSQVNQKHHQEVKQTPREDDTSSIYSIDPL